MLRRKGAPPLPHLLSLVRSCTTDPFRQPRAIGTESNGTTRAAASTAECTKRRDSGTSKLGENLSTLISTTKRVPDQLTCSHLVGYRVEGAGSFLRTDAKGLDVVGKTFIAAVSQKYLGEESFPSVPSSESLPEEATTTSSSVDGSSVQRFATASNFDVEVVLNHQVTDRFKQLGRLREVGLEWENVSAALSTRQAPGDAAAERGLEDFGAQLKSTVLCLASLLRGLIAQRSARSR